MRGLGEQYRLAVPSNTLVRDLEGHPPAYSGRGAPPKPPFQRVDRWRASLPEEAWSRVEVRDGEKGPLAVEIVKARVVARTEHSRTQAQEEVLVVMRVLDEDKHLKHDYYVSNAPLETPLEEFARVGKAEHRVEECLERDKSEAGLGDYEVRTWTGWCHHQALCLLAVWFLVQETRRGKKTSSGDHPASNPRGACPDPARRLRLRQPRAHRRRKDPATPAQRGGTILSLEST